MFTKLYKSVRLSAFLARRSRMMAAPARAGIVLTVEAPGVQSSSVANAVTETFDARALGSYTTITSSIGTYTASVPGLKIVAPDAFGGANQTQYMAVGCSSPTTSADLTFFTPQSYFGLYWSAIDAQNVLQVYNGATLLETINETPLTPCSRTRAALRHRPLRQPEHQRRHLRAFVYLNISGTAGTTFTDIRFINNTTGTSFESDNHTIQAVPEPSTLATSSFFAIAALGYSWPRRRPSGPGPSLSQSERTPRRDRSYFACRTCFVGSAVRTIPDSRSNRRWSAQRTLQVRQKGGRAQPCPFSIAWACFKASRRAWTGVMGSALR